MNKKRKVPDSDVEDAEIRKWQRLTPEELKKEKERIGDAMFFWKRLQAYNAMELERMGAQDVNTAMTEASRGAGAGSGAGTKADPIRLEDKLEDIELPADLPVIDPPPPRTKMWLLIDDNESVDSDGGMYLYKSKENAKTAQYDKVLENIMFTLLKFNVPENKALWQDLNSGRVRYRDIVADVEDIPKICALNQSVRGRQPLTEEEKELLDILVWDSAGSGHDAWIVREIEVADS